MSEQSLQVVERAAPVAMTAAPQISFSAEQVQLIKNTIAKGASDDELSLFMNIAKRTGLDPFARQIFYIKRWDASAGREVGQPQTSIDGYRLIAERTGCYCPGRDPEFSLGIDGFLLSATAFIKKWVRGEWHEISATAYWDEYAQKKKDGSLTPMWHRMPRTMLAKCAESLALRKAFPAELSGIYTREEMMQAENEYEPPPPATAPPPKPTKPTPPKPSEFTPIGEVFSSGVPAPPVVEGEIVEQAASAQPTGLATQATAREEAVADIKRTLNRVKLVTGPALWREFERGLLGCTVHQADDVALFAARDAVANAAKNADILRWNAESWVSSAEQQAYTMGLIAAHAHVDGFDKTKAICGEPARLTQFKQIQRMQENLLSWLGRTEELQQAAA